MEDLIVIGGGLAGCEAAWQAAKHGVRVTLFEMRPLVTTGAHIGSRLAELVCSNSFGSTLVDRASGLLKEEIHRLGSFVLDCAAATALPAGRALAVDRDAFASLVTERVTAHPNIRVVRDEITEIPKTPVIIASGPLTSEGLSRAISLFTGKEHLFFFDAIAPIVSVESVNMEIAFKASRYDQVNLNQGDYINCPLTRQEYHRFIEALLSAERIELKQFELEVDQGVRVGTTKYFEGCLPIEVLARRGQNVLAYGPMRPVGLVQPQTDRRPYAVVQLRQDNLAATLYNLVGFQTNLKYTEQQRVFRMIPGLENAEFVRYGHMHRNTYIFSPAILSLTMQSKLREDVFFAGQIVGVEGYVGNIAIGVIAGLNSARFLLGEKLFQLPRTTMLGALCHYISSASEERFQPMKANFGILPPLDDAPIKPGKQERGRAYSERAINDINTYLIGMM